MLVDDDVARLDVVVYYRWLASGQVFQYLADLDRVSQDIVGWQQLSRQRLASGFVFTRQPPAQVRPLDILHHQILMTPLGKVGIQIGNAGMFQVAQSTGFRLKALGGFLPFFSVRGVKVFDDFFQHRQPVKCLGLGDQPDGSHPALAQRPDHTVRAAIQQLAWLQASNSRSKGRLAGGAIASAGPVQPTTVWARNTQESNLTS